MLSTFEILPDEIIMIIMKYSGDVFTIFRTYHGLNQRLNYILLDKRLHILADFLHINVRHRNFDNYYNSHVFQEVSMKDSVTEQQLRLFFQSLIVFHINEQYTQLGKEFQSNTENIKTVREHFTNEQLLEANDELKKAFNDLPQRSIRKSDIERIELLVLKKGARLECNDHHIGYFNLTKALNKLLFAHINNARPITRSNADSIVKLFKLLILSNPNLLKNRDDISCGGCTAYFFLFGAIYQLECINYLNSSSLHCVSVNMNCYRAVVDLSLFIIQCQKQVYYADDWCDGTIFEILAMLANSKKTTVDDELLIQTSRLEILKIVFNERVLKASAWDEVLISTIERTLRNLLKTNRLDMILLICDHYEYIQDIFNNLDQNRQFVDIMTGDRLGRELFQVLMEKKIFHNWFNDKYLVFILLEKKERKLLEKLIILSPSLINQLDKDGNDPLLHICLKVRGCRHRIIEFLIQIGCNLRRQNSKGQDFIQAIQLEQNRKLLKHLIQRKLFKISEVSGKMQVLLAE